MKTTPNNANIPTSDLSKARVTIYSILMGFVLKFFLEHLYEIKEAIYDLYNYDFNNFITYILILSFFFVNCFRYLFGLITYANMTHSNFSSATEDWEWSKIFINISKSFVVNTGVFQLIIFSFGVFLLFPSVYELNNTAPEFRSELLKNELPRIIVCFSFTTLLLVVFDVFSVFLYKLIVPEESFNEFINTSIWIKIGIFEILLALCLLFEPLLIKASIKMIVQNTILGLLLLLVLLENLSIFRYLEDYWLKLYRKKTNDQEK